LSYNHDNDIFYRFLDSGSFGWGFIASLNLRTIYCFGNPYILDLGCADGFYYRRFLSKLDNVNYIGCDLDSYAIQKAQKYVVEHNCDASFLCLDFVNNMPVPNQQEYFTNIFWYSSMQMFEDETQKVILTEIKNRLGNEGILCGSVSIKSTGWKYCINSMENEEQVYNLLKQYFKHVWVYSDCGMGNDACFMASQKELPMLKYSI